jgi:hypothetical protein
VYGLEDLGRWIGLFGEGDLLSWRLLAGGSWQVLIAHRPLLPQHGDTAGHLLESSIGFEPTQWLTDQTGEFGTGAGFVFVDEDADLLDLF